MFAPLCLPQWQTEQAKRQNFGFIKLLLSRDCKLKENLCIAQ